MKKSKVTLNKVLYIILCLAMFVSFLSMLIVWNTHITHSYDSKVFFVSDENVPLIKDVTFEANTDGTHTAKLFGIFPMGRCAIYKVDRPTVEIVNTGLYIQAKGVGSVQLKEFSFENSPAEQAGLKIGDYIYSCNGFKVSNTDWDLSGSVSYVRPNIITVIRDGEYLTFEVPTNEENKMGITYGPARAILGTLCFKDGDYFWGIGHNTDIDTVNAQGAFAVFSIEDNAIEPVASTRELDYTIKSTTDKGILGQIENQYDFMQSREVDLAWAWEVDTSKPAILEIPLTDREFEEEEALDATYKQKVAVNIQKCSGKVRLADGQIAETPYTYKIISSDFEFLKGMSGSPVFQNNRLIGVLSAVDASDPHTAFILSAEDAYAQYLQSRKELT